MAILNLLQREFLNASQMAELLGLGRVQTIGDWVKTGKLPQGVSLGGHKVWPVEALKKIIQQRCIEHGYTKAEVVDLFSRASLRPPGDCIEVRVPVAKTLSERGAARLGQALGQLIELAMNQPPELPPPTIDATATYIDHDDAIMEHKIEAWQRGEL